MNSSRPRILSGSLCDSGNWIDPNFEVKFKGADTMKHPLTEFPPHFLSLEFMTGQQLESLYELTDRIRNKELEVATNRRVGLIFEKPSTRTRVSFEVALDQLDGTSIYLSKDDIQLSRGESIPDTARTLSRYLDGIVCRTYGHDRIESLAEYSSIPVVNALTDWVHPCQVLADLYTIKNDFDGTTPRLAFVGDGNNVCHSLMIGSWLLEIPLRVSGPKPYMPNQTLFESLSDRGGDIEWTSDPNEAVSGAHYVYTDVWASMGQEDEAERRRKEFEPYQVNESLLKHADKSVRILHCLPAHRGEEITSEVLDGPRSLVFEQAENRLHVQKALLAVLLSEETALEQLFNRN